MGIEEAVIEVAANEVGIGIEAQATDTGDSINFDCLPITSLLSY